MSVKQSSFSPVQNQSDTETQRSLPCLFTDVEHLNDFFGYRQLQVIQLTPGSLESELLSVKIGDLYFISICSFERDLVQVSQNPPPAKKSP